MHLYEKLEYYFANLKWIYSIVKSRPVKDYNELARNESHFLLLAITLFLAITLHFLVRLVRPYKAKPFKTRAFTAMAHSLDLYRL